MPKFDVVVVGAGNAGLSAALQMVQSGKKTLLIEQHNLPGGCASSFCRGRFEFDPSLHELCDFGPEDNPGDVRNILDGFGVKLEWCRVDDCFRAISKFSDGTPMDVSMPSTQKAFIDKMEEYVPGSRAKMTKLFDLFEEILQGIAYITRSAGHPDSEVLKRDYPDMLRTGAYSTSKVFEALKLPQKCRDILSVYWAYLGVDMDHLAFIHYAAMVHKYVTRSAYIPKHTSHDISVSLVERFKELGGEAWFNCRANRFVFDGDRCCGVETSMGKVDCDYVLANIVPDIIYGKMMPQRLVPAREKQLVKARNRQFGGRMFTTYIGLNKTAEELGIKDYSIFMLGSSNSAEEFRTMQSIKTNEYTIFLCYNIVNPEFSPKGTCVCRFTSMYGSEDWSKLEEKDYVKTKNEIARRFLTQLKEKTGLDLSPYIEEISVATPWTFARYLNAAEGGVYGYLTTGWDGMMARMQSIATDYPIKGLRPIGTNGPRGDGYSAAYICGQLIAKTALKEMAGGK